MMRETIYGEVFNAPALQTASIATNTTTNGVAIDSRQGRNNFRVGAVIVTTGVITDGTYVVKVQESATSGGTYTDIPASRLQGTPLTITSTGASASKMIGFIPDPASKPFVRVAITSTAVTTGGQFGATMLLSSGRSAPVAHA
jgi:hypothetical protein